MNPQQILSLNPIQLQEALLAVAKSIDGGGYGNFSGGDVTLQTGSAALRPENLDKVLKSLTFTDEMATFWKKAPKRDSKTIVTEAATKDLGTVAGFYEDGGLPSTMSDFFARLVRNIKFIGVQGKVTNVSIIQDLIVQAEAEETANKTLALIHGLDVEGVHGNSAINARAFDGILTQFNANIGSFASQNTKDMEGGVITIEDFSNAARVIAENYGNPTRLNAWMGFGPLAEFNNQFTANPQFFVNGNGNGVVKSPIGADIGDGGIIKNPYGPGIKLNTNVFMGTRRPMILNQAKTSGIAVGLTPPAAAVVTPTAADDATSRLSKSTVYRYYVVSVGVDGMSAPTVVADVTTDSTNFQKITLAITKTAGALETGYRIWRLKFPAYNPLSLATHVGDVVVAEGATTTFVDKGELLDGCTEVFVLDWAEEVFRWDVLLFMGKIPIANLGDYKAWIQRNWSTPFLIQPKKMFVFKNVKAYALRTT